MVIIYEVLTLTTKTEKYLCQSLDLNDGHNDIYGKEGSTVQPMPIGV